MKYLLIILLGLVGFGAKAQFPSQQTPTQFSTGWFKQGWHQADSGHILANRLPNFTPRFPGTIILYQNGGTDTAIHYWTGGRWIKISPTGTDTTSLSNRINLKVNISDTALMLLPYLRKADTTNKWVQDVYVRNDSLFKFKNGTETFLDTLGNGSSPGSGLTSVGLSLPSAFTVTNSPLTSNGTLNVIGAGTTLQYVRGNGTLATTDSGMIPNFHLKVRSLFSGTSPITFNSTSGAIGINNATATGTKGAAAFTGSFSDNGSGLIDLLSVITAGSCTNCDLTFDAKGRITAASNGSGGSGSGVDTIYRTPGVDSIYFTINGGAQRAIKDSAGASSGGTVTSVSGTSNRITVTSPTTTPVIDIAATYVGQTSITTLGTIATGVWNGTAIGATFGGTGQTSVTTGDLLYGSASNTWGKLAGVATGNALISGGVTTAPSWGKIGLTTHVSGILPVANGGTGTATPSLVAGTDISITGTWPNQTINATGSGTPSLTATQIAFGSDPGNTITSEAAFNYISATNKLSVDSIVFKKALADSIMMGVYESDLPDSATYFGTSITAGTDATPVAVNRYSAIVSAGLRVNEINKGLGGYLLQHSPSWPLTNTFKDVYTMYIQPKTATSRYLFFAWGENDANAEQLYGALFNVDTSFFKRDYGIVVNYAVSLGWSLSDIRIISPFYQLTNRASLAIQQKYVDCSRHFADSMGLVWIDVFTEGANYGQSILADDIHPSNYGHSLHAYTILKGVNQLLQAQNGENLINANTTLLNSVKFFGKDTATLGYGLLAVNANGTMTKVPSERYLILSNSNTPVQSGNAAVVGNINAGGGLRAIGDNTFTTGAGFQISYDGVNGKLLPINWSGPSFGNILMPFSKLVVNGGVTSPYTTLYVQGAASAEAVYSSGSGNIAYNTNTNTTTLNMLVSGDSVGHITTFGVGSLYKRLSLNGTSIQPVVINTLADNGSGAKLQVNGPISVATHALAANSDSAVVWNRTTSAYEYAKINSSGGSQTWQQTLTTGSTLTGNNTVTGGNNSFTFNGMFNYRINANSFVLDKTTATAPYSFTVLGADNVFQLAYTPTPATYSKGAGIIIDTNNNTSVGSQIPTTAPLYAIGNSAFVNGIQNQSGNFFKVDAITSNITAGLDDYYFKIDATSGNITITLPAASAAFGASMGIRYVFKRIDASINTVTVARAGSDVIDGATSVSLVGQYSKTVLQCSSSSTWDVLP